MKRFIWLLFSFLISLPVLAQLKMEKTNGGLLFKENNRKVLFYQVEPKSVDGKFERCNYIHPLWGVDGTILTEDFPADHLHQRGVFWAWHQILLNNKSIGDGWAIENFAQKVTHTEVAALSDGSAVLKTRVNWKSGNLKNGGDEVPYLKEETTITIHPQKENYRKIDFKISLLALKKELKIGGSDNEKGYGGFSVRMALPNDVLFSGPAGIIEPQNIAVKSRGYVNVSGSLLNGDKKGGIVIIDHPGNPGYPQSWILRKQKSMQNPVFPGRVAVPVSTVEPLLLMYSLLVYSGNLSNKKIEQIIKDQTF